MKDLAVIKVQSDPKYLSVIRVVTAKMGELYGLSESAKEDVKLAVDEACSNVIKHAYGGDTHQSILVRYRRGKKGFEVLIEDNGVKVQPESIEGRSLDDIRPGGLGVHLIKRTFDIFQFDRRRTKGNRLRLVRFTK
jgi:anti-sigma regulatory factor (Ser/Thr protein kinase)